MEKNVQVTLVAAKHFFETQIRPKMPCVGQVEWEVINGVPYVNLNVVGYGAEQTLRFEKCNCNHPECLGIQPRPGLIH